MQRMALRLTLAALVVAGCAPTRPNAQIKLGPPLNPLLQTRATPTVPDLGHESLGPPVVEGAVSRGVIIPPGGITPGRWQCIVVHHSASPKSTPKGMDYYHRHDRGWENGLGYHFVVGNGIGYPDGQVYVGPRWKRQIHGAHCASDGGRYFGAYRKNGYFNQHGIGICLIGNYEEEYPTAKQLATLERLIAQLCIETGIPADRVYGHGEVTHKTACPGRHTNMRTVRRAVAALTRSAEISWMDWDSWRYANLRTAAEREVHGALQAVYLRLELPEGADGLPGDGVHEIAAGDATGRCGCVGEHLHHEQAPERAVLAGMLDDGVDLDEPHPAP